MSNIPVSIETTQSYPVSMGIAVTPKASDLSELDVTENGTYTASDGHGYNPVVVNVAPTLQSKTATPTESAQTISPDTGYDGLSSVAVGAISSTYVGSGITRQDSESIEDLLDPEGGALIPSGYYEENVWFSVPEAYHSSPTVSINSAGLITASHTQAKGYVSTSRAGTETDTLQLSTQAAATINPTESEQTAVASGKYTTGTVKVGAISSTYVGSGISRKSSTDLTASGATVTAPAGYYSSQATKTVASGTAGTPTATKGTVSNHSVSVTPSVTNTTGYITGSTKTGTAVTVSASELVSGSETKTANGTYDVTNLASLIVNVSGGGGDGKAAQISQTPGRATSSTYTAVGPSITVTKAGTYDVYWSGYRSSTSGTSGSQLYINNTAYGTAQTTFNTSLTNLQSVHLTGVSLNANDVLTVRARSRGSGYYMYIQDLIIIEA